MPWNEKLEEENQWIDLEIVETWGIPKRYVAGSFPEDVWIREQKCEFARQQILKGQMSITIPKDIEMVPESSEDFLATYIKELCSDWFPLAELYISKEWNCGFAFLLEEIDEEKEYGDIFYERTVSMMESYDEEIMFYDKEVEESYITFTVKCNLLENDQIYSFPFLVKTAQKQLVGIIVCNADDAAIWNMLSRQILRSAI